MSLKCDFVVGCCLLELRNRKKYVLSILTLEIRLGLILIMIMLYGHSHDSPTQSIYRQTAHSES